MTILQYKEVIWLFHELVFSGIVILSCAFFFFNENKSSKFADSSLLTNDDYLYVGTFFKQNNQNFKGKSYIF